jgi:hypothetical protein
MPAAGLAHAPQVCFECTRREDECERTERIYIRAFAAFTRESHIASPSEFERLRSDASHARFNSEVARMEYEQHALIHAKAG